MARAGWREVLAVNRVLVGGQLSRYGGRSGSTTNRFERELAEKFDVGHALGVNSGTNALICALVGVGVGPGDEVLVPSYTWVSTAAAPLSLGAIPILVNIDESLTIDPADIERKITDRTRAIIPVHMNNTVCDMDSIMKIAVDHGLAVVEDACQAFGVSHHGKRAGTIGHAGAFSFNQHKNITSGEGGAVVTNDALIAERAATYHDVGSFIRSRESTADVPAFIGINARMSELASAMLRPQLRRIDRQIARRQSRRQVFLEALEGSPSFSGRLVAHHDEDAAASLLIQFDDKDAAERFAQKRGVSRLIDSGRHVFTNWEPVREKRLHDERLNPFATHPHLVDYGDEQGAVTLDILERTCSVGLPPSVPLVAFHALARSMFT